MEIDVGGVWYEVELPAFVWRALEEREVGEEVELETFYFVTQNAPIPRLIGFLREVERGFFEKLVTVPNVGPTTATKALVFSVSTIARWIEDGRHGGAGPAAGDRQAQRRDDRGAAAGQGDRKRRCWRTRASTSRSRSASRGRARSRGTRPTRWWRWATAAAEAERLVAQVDAESAPETVEETIRAVFRRLNPG